jgi:hypothetical protein
VKTIHAEKALQIHRSKAMLRDEFQASQMSLFRDTPLRTQRRESAFLKGEKNKFLPHASHFLREVA